MVDTQMSEKQNSYIVKDLAGLDNLAKQILLKSTAKVFLFYGDLGAGKTSLIKSMVKHLGIEEQVSSPTYALINEYQSNDLLVYHMDLYRLKYEEEAYDIGIEDYLYSDNYSFIEWPQVIEGIIDVPYHVIKLEELEDNTRKLLFK